VSQVRRIVGRLLFQGSRMLVRPLEFIDARLFMKAYLRILRRHGLNLTGAPRFISSRAWFDNLSKIHLGEKVVISRDVRFLTHDYSVTTGLIAIGDPPEVDVSIHGEIVVEDNVFIGLGAIILPGTIVRANSIVGAGAVVKGDIPLDSMVIGNPANVVAKTTSRAHHWRELRDSDRAMRDRN
jgi:acetyltransferase-like isoleucine patch superfamily enzyme